MVIFIINLICMDSIGLIQTRKFNPNYLKINYYKIMSISDLVPFLSAESDSDSVPSLSASHS